MATWKGVKPLKEYVVGSVAASDKEKHEITFLMFFNITSFT